MIQHFKKCFTKGESSSESITRSAALIAIMGLVSRFLGLVRDRILASRFGAGDILDSYYAAFKIPDLVYTLLVLGALSAAFVPVFTSLNSKQKKKEAWQLVNVMIGAVILILSVVVAIIYFLAPTLISWMTFGYDQEKRDVIVDLTRIMLVSPIILGVSGIIGGTLNSFKKFFFYSLAPIFYNAGIIIGALFLASENNPKGLALGVILGAIMHLIIQIPEVVRCGFKIGFKWKIVSRYFKKVISLMIPRTMGLAVAQINLLIVTILASTLESGSLAIFNFANNLQSVPMGLFGISFAVAAFPTLSCLWASNEQSEFANKFRKTLCKILFFIIPVSAFIYILRAQIVRVILGSGHFDWNATTLTFEALGIFAISLWAQSSIPLLARAFYAIHNTKIPFFSGIVSEAVNLILALILIDQFKILGLVTAFTVSTCLNAFILLGFLRFKVGYFKEKGIIKMVLKTGVSTIFAVIAVQFLKNLVGVDPFGEEQTFLGVFTQLSISLMGGVIVFVLVGKWIKLREIDYFIKIVKRRIDVLIFVNKK